MSGWRRNECRNGRGISNAICIGSKAEWHVSCNCNQYAQPSHNLSEFQNHPSLTLCHCHCQSRNNRTKCRNAVNAYQRQCHAAPSLPPTIHIYGFWQFYNGPIFTRVTVSLSLEYTSITKPSANANHSASVRDNSVCISNWPQ